MVSYALDDRDGPAVANGEALAGPAGEECPARSSAVEARVADDRALVRDEARPRRRPHGNDPSREALADVVVGIALEHEEQTGGGECTEALPRRTARLHDDG